MIIGAVSRSVKLIAELTYEEKLKVAKKMKQRLASSNRQITQILAITKTPHRGGGVLGGFVR